ncbi:hypothetical protein [Streptomyces poonensis]|uniref:Uncharacterized protein n=1 Tax=Streptomyces poonensis TaxID=68255 RepID=A0A918PT25_9ACTN|nr:hypothetical protein [Streptomyces poonensis]GGZ20275.1 hypothetical protein GCM10010365_45720 [Streptomyces poonensis]
MLTGPEATIVARAGGAIVQGVKGQATTSPQWPALHASLLELHAIVDAWVGAAAESATLIQHKLNGMSSPPRRVRWKGPFNFGGSVTMIGGTSNIAYGVVEGMSQQVSQQLAPKVSFVKRLTPGQRQQAARRNLRNMMRVYCPDLLSEFENATDRRRAWVVANRVALSEALTAQSVDRESLRVWAQEALGTMHDLVVVRDELAALIREKYPMGHGSPEGR